MALPTDHLSPEQLATINATDAAHLAALRATGQPVAITPRELLTKLRYQDPTMPTLLEQRLIPVFRQAFPQLASDLNSYQTKPTGCGCSGRVQVVIARNEAAVQAVLNQVYEGPLYKLVSPPASLPLPGGSAVIGRTEVIDATPEAWTACFAKLAASNARGSDAALKQMYNGVHVRDIPGVGSNPPKWMLLFY